MTTRQRKRPWLLEEQVPGLPKEVTPVEFLDLPTPVLEERRLARYWGLRSLHVKRDDLTSTLYGGSKSRMLEYFLGQAIARKKTSVATMGPHISHQALGIAVYANKLGLKSYAVLAPQPAQTEEQLRYQSMYRRWHMDTLHCNHYFSVPWAYLRTRLRRDKPYWIPAGGNDPLGILAIVEGALELAADIVRRRLPLPDDIVVPTGTCATAAGVYLGMALARLPVRVVAVRMVPQLWTSPNKLRHCANKTLALLRRAGFNEPVNWGDLLWVGEHFPPGYGLSNPRADAAIKDVANLSALRTETTYTGKSWAVFKTDLLQNRRVVFWNTYSAVDPVPTPKTAPVSMAPLRLLEQVSL